MKKLDTVPNGEMIIYENSDGKTIIDVRFDEDTLWLTQMQMADLFGVQKAAISKHLKNIFESEELIENAVVSILETTAADGKNYPTKYYNLDAVIAVGYRVNSKRATAFRIWATNILKDYIKKGFAMDDDRLKELGGGGYFKELLERIRDIRASEKVFYRQVLEIYATSIDYDPKAEVSVLFFKRVQNKIHYAVSGETAAEVIYHRADAEKDFMGLMSFSGEQPTLREAKIAKNYNCKVIAFAGSVTEEAKNCNEKGIDAFFSILPGVCSLDEAMNTETAQKNMRNAVEQVFRLILTLMKEKYYE